jgi:hypothetical protein
MRFATHDDPDRTGAFCSRSINVRLMATITAVPRRSNCSGDRRVIREEAPPPTNGAGQRNVVGPAANTMR